MFSKLKGVPSLSLRLVIWYAGASFLLLLLGSGSMYVELLRAYDSSDAQSISRKATTLRELVRQQDLPTLKWEIEIPGPGLGYIRLSGVASKIL